MLLGLVILYYAGQRHVRPRTESIKHVSFSVVLFVLFCRSYISRAVFLKTSELFR